MDFDIFYSSNVYNSSMYMLYKDDKEVSLVKFDILKNDLARKSKIEE